jgi:hypothetical protein
MQAIANDADTSQESIQKIFSGKNLPQSPAKLMDIARAIDATPEELKQMEAYYRKHRQQKRRGDEAGHTE